MRDDIKIIAEVNGTMTMEGMPLTEEDKDRILVVLRGEVTAKEMVKRLVEKYTVKKGVANEQSL